MRSASPVNRERHRAIVEHVGQAPGCVAGCRAGLERATAELDAVAVREQAVRSLGPACSRDRNAAAGALLVQPCTRDVVRVHMRLDRPQQLQPKLLDERAVALRLLENRIDQHRLP
jgi:hypothetical protein